jgi:probable HAF family extracellular repeat protein
MTQDQDRAQYTPPMCVPPGIVVEGAGKMGMRPMKSGLLLAASAAAFLMAAGPARAAWNFVTLVDPSDAIGYTVASGINNSGEVVGSYEDSSFQIHGFTYNNPTYTTVDIASSAATAISGVNNAGSLAGNYTGSGNVVHGFAGASAPLDNPAPAGNTATYQSGINGSGTTVGYYKDAGLSTHGFVQSAGVFTSFDVPGTTQSTQGLGINAAGTIVGSFVSGGETHGFVGTLPSSLVQVDDPLGVEGTVVTGIDSAGDLVGYYVDGGGVSHGFLDVAGVMTTIDVPNSGPGVSTEIWGISPLGSTVVGYTIDSSVGVFKGFVATVPEPATFTLFGMATLGAMRLRRRRSLTG